VSEDFTETWLRQVVRAADAGILVVDLAEPALLEEIEVVERTLEEWRAAPPRLLVGNKADLPGASGNLAALEDLYRGRYPCLAVSALTGENLDAFRGAVFDLLGLVRVYTKAPGKQADLDSPFLLHRGQTVQDAARLVHKDFAEHLKFARLFRLSHHHDGLMVERTHVVEDQDILEFHI
jgi:ribosome-interacting GTPase 1